ncbi:MAG: hypothetical protein WAM46_18510 [Flavobacterium sp.]
MDTINHISKTKLPSHQDFNFLKGEAIDFIQNHIGKEWTNFNPSDPGMTILDQFCYALTELGYCTDFSIPDILTDATGKIAIDDQFYLPYKILTTSPYTINDYRKYLIDGNENIFNVTIISYNNNIFPINRIYQVYLYINPDIIDVNESKNICKSAFYYLNKSRNLGEIFNLPIALQAQNCWIGGKIEITKEVDLYAVLLELQSAIREFIFAKPAQLSFETLIANGYNAAAIYDGPYLKNGWILNESLTDKIDQIKAINLIPVIESVTGIVTVSGLQLYQDEKIVSVLQTTVNQILSIDILGSYKSKNLTITCNGKEVPFDAFGPLMITPDKFEETTANLNNKAHLKLPKSNFRDINTYYSIQNTFPQQYNIGADKVADDSAPIQVAQSRQLKGYLTLFDQILANQFSQLANVSKLFSFTNSVCGAPSDEESFYAVKDKEQQKNLEYPVPYKMFSPSYFYQSLYTVPHIRPILKDSKTFDYSFGNETEAEQKETSWFDYQQDPYNPYIFGMMKLIEEEDVNLDRRNKLLDHLLARHGESPKIIDTIINDTIYTGDKRKDQLILKSLYLQNLGLLTYNRQKGYNFLSASKIADNTSGNIDVSLPVIKSKHLGYINENTTDFIFKSEHINKKEKLSRPDFNNFSGLELKLNLLFGLKNIYSNFITSQFDIQQKNIENQLNTYKTIQKTFWFKEKRNGSILIETLLLLNQLTFNLEIISQNQVNTTSYSILNIDFQTISNLNYAVNTTEQNTLDTHLGQGYLVFSGVQFPVITKTSETINTADYTKSELSNYSFRITIASGNGSIAIDNSVFKKNIILVFPDFIPVLQKAEFKKRLKYFLKNNLPVNVSCECLFLSLQELESFIPDYVKWHESLRFKSNLIPLLSEQDPAIINNPAPSAPTNPAETAINLITSLTSILATKNGRNK